MSKKVIYQPILTVEEWETGKLPSFGVYHELENAKKDYPEHLIAAYFEDEIQEPTYMDADSTRYKEAIENACHYLCDSDELTMEQQVEAIAKQADEDGSVMIDEVEGVIVWEPIEDTYDCDEFLQLINW
jgi:hypothetical protein